jgi:hypothetical protein
MKWFTTGFVSESIHQKNYQNIYIWKKQQCHTRKNKKILENMDK